MFGDKFVILREHFGLKLKELQEEAQVLNFLFFSFVVFAC
jgi:hypothetical protein